MHESKYKINYLYGSKTLATIWQAKKKLTSPACQPLYLWCIYYYYLFDLKLIQLVLGYGFNEYEEINLLDNDFKHLYYWPSNIDIDDAINIDLEPELSLEKLYGACKVLIEWIQKLPDILWFPSDSRSKFILDNKSLNIKFLLNLRQYHDAYSEKNLEQIKFSSKNNNERSFLNGFNINKARSLVSHLTKNNFILTKLRENRWKSSRNNNNNVVEKNHL
ncbi:10480_t:CDS:2, partial [Dentiscutata erythropus]